jgi:hypothetical protein
MSKPPKPTKDISAEQASIQQREIAELLNPEIEVRKKQAIGKSPKNSPESEVFYFPNLPEKVLIEVTNAGLDKDLLMVPKCRWQGPKTGDKITHLLNFIRKYGKVMKHEYKPETA